MEQYIFLSIQNVNIPLSNRNPKYIISCVNYLNLRYKIAEESLLKIFHESFFFFMYKFFLEYYLLIPTIHCINQMLNNIPPRIGRVNTYPCEGSDSDFEFDLGILQNIYYYNMYISSYQSRVIPQSNMKNIDIEKIKIILSTYIEKCEKCKINKPLVGIVCERNHKVFFFF
jgi:hypothetical protein